MDKSQIEILKKAIYKYGVSNQIDMLHEEIGELLQAINKVKRNDGLTENGGFLEPNELTDLKYSKLYFDLCREVADVKIMLMQLELMLNQEAINISVERKITRLFIRLNK